MTHEQLDLFGKTVDDTPIVSQKFKIYKSSAGSGKTFTLAKDFLKILLRDPADYKHVLAITFTNKATEEMKTRILEYLEEISDDRPTTMRKIIEDEFREEKINIAPVITKRARKALNNILHDYSRFEVSTIDYFFTRVVRALARELDLPMRYDMDVDNEKALLEAIKKLYLELNENEDLRTWLEDFSFNRIENNKGWRIDRNIIDLGMELFKEKFHSGLSRGKNKDIEELKSLVSQLKNTVRSFHDTLDDYCREAITLIEASDLTLDNFKANTAYYFYRVLNNKDYSLTQTFRNLAEGSDNWYRAKDVHLTDRINALGEKGLDRIAREFVAYHDKHYKTYNSASELLKNIYSYGLLGILNQKLAEYKNENNLLLLSDTNYILRGVISDNDAPFLYEKMGGWYKYVLIDEFQDTSRYQWKNLLPLVINSLSNNHQGLLVGDIKQAVYRWRGGDLSLLLDEVQQDLSNYKKQIQEERLTKNWRSSENIVEFNNAFFELARQVLDDNPEFPEGRKYIYQAYGEVVQQPTRKGGGYINIRFFKGWDTWKEEAKRETINLIWDLKNQGFGLKDILILVDMRDLANEIARALTEAKIDVVTENSLHLSSSRIVNLMVSLFYWMSNQDDKHAVANIAFLYTVIKKGNTGNLPELLNSEDPIKECLPGSFVERASFLKAKPVHELIEEIIIHLDLADEVDIFLQRFQDICLEQATLGNHDIRSFLLWWEDANRRRDKQNELSVVVPAGSNAVQVMTIHKAKGLEAPVVILPFASYGFRPRYSTFWTTSLNENYRKYGILPLNHSKVLAESHFEGAYRQELMEEYLERLNVTYVAFTRPREQLHIFAPDTTIKPNEEISKVYKLLKSVLTDPGFSLSEYWSEKEMRFELGERSPSRGPEGEDRAPDILKSYSASQFADKIVLREDSRQFFTLLDSTAARKVNEGILAHTVLERIREKEDIEGVISMLLDTGIADPSILADVKEKVLKLFEDQTFSSWFDPGWHAYAERSILYKGETYRPDRVLLKEDQAIVIDYKREKRDSHYTSQIETYASLLSEMGYKTVKKYIVYIENLEIEEI